jgi:DNA polymerase I-like protein with 3'-5' exonuclease and polymerase domains
MKIIVVDLETSIKNKGEDAIGKFPGSPYHPDNKIVWYGLVYPDIRDKAYSVSATECSHFESFMADDDISLLVGQNFKFDLHYLVKRHPEIKEFLRTGSVWDIQLAEYLLTGQESKMASLDAMCEKYDLPLKDKKIQEYWNAGVDTEDIPEEEIKSYVEMDAYVTHQIFKKQLAKAKELNMLPLINTQMEALLATFEMEHNGMKFDKVSASNRLETLLDRLGDYKETFYDELNEILPTDYTIGNILYNPLSNTQLSGIIFGGISKTKRFTIVKDEYDNAIRYKSGKKKGRIKTKIIKEDIILDRIVPSSVSEPTKRKGIFKVDEEVINKVLEHIEDLILSSTRIKYLQSALETLLLIRSLEKDISTYYEPYIKLTWPHDGCIHPQYTHCVTATGRLSSSSPNLQNVSNDHDK